MLHQEIEDLRALKEGGMRETLASNQNQTTEQELSNKSTNFKGSTNLELSHYSK